MSSFTPQDSSAAEEESAAESPSSLKKLRVKEIKKRLEKLQVDHSKCVEKSDLVSLLSKSLPTSKSDKIDFDIERLRMFVTDKIIKNDDVEPSVRGVGVRALVFERRVREYESLSMCFNQLTFSCYHTRIALILLYHRKITRTPTFKKKCTLEQHSRILTLEYPNTGTA